MSESTIFHLMVERRLGRVLNATPNEIKALIWSFLYFFSLLCSYYIIRPLRDEMGVAGGVEKLHWLFTGTFIVMLLAIPVFGWLTKHFRRSRFLPAIYLFFITNLLLFFLMFQFSDHQLLTARAFFIWTSVYNLFVVSVFWSFMADVFNDDQAKRLFGVIAAGGTTGAIVGPIVASSFSLWFGTNILLLISSLLLATTIVCIRKISLWSSLQGGVSKDDHQNQESAQGTALGGSIWGGVKKVLSSYYLLGIAVLMLLFTTLSTFLYFQQAQIISDSFANPAHRTAVFAGMDLAVNTLTLVLQLLVTGRLIRQIGLAWSLALVPLLLCVGFLALSLMPVLGVIVLVQVLRRAGNYAITRPGREMLYVVLDRESKYKAKNVNDTVMYRGGDAISAWAYAALKGLGLSLSQIALIAVPLAALWAGLAYALGRQQEKMSPLHDKGVD